MAGNRQQFTLQFNADTSQAKKAIEDLNKSLQNLQKAQSNSGFADLGINKAVESAKELSEHLNKALNVNTGKLNLSTFQNSLQASNTSLKSLTNDLLKAGTVGQQAFLAIAGAIAQAEVPLRQTNKTIKDFAQTLKNTVKWEISSTAVHSLESALSGAVSYIKGLNSSLNNIRIVTGQSAEDMVQFAEQANRAARELSTTTKAYTDASLIYYQQGDTQEQAAKKAAITIKAANSSFNTSAAEMSEYLTAVWNSYQVGADELERYVDIMAALGAKTATSLEEIATSMQKVAATANTVGVSMEQVSSIISTVSSVTRESAESIGTSYKTIFARIGDLKLGEALDDGVTLGQVSSQLDKIGVKILDTNGEMRDMGDIIEDLGSKWQNMSRAEQTAIAQVVAGKRQYTQLMALFENWDMYQNNMNIAKNADGSLENMYKIQAESVEASSARMQAALENLYSKFINDQSIIQFTESITGIVDAITSVIDAFGGLPGVLGNVGAIAIKVFSKDIAGGIDKTLAKLTTFTSQFTGKNTFTKVTKGIGMTLTGHAQSVQQIEQQKAMAQARVAIEEQKQGVFNESGRFAVDEASQLLSYKERLLSIQHQLTDAQKEEAQAALNNLSSQQAEIIKLKADKEQMQKDEENALRKEKQAILHEHSGTNALGGKFMSSQDKQTHIERQMLLQYDEGYKDNYYKNLTTADISSIDAMLQKSKELGIQLEKTDQALEMIRSQLRSGDIQQTGAKFDILKEKIEQLLGQKLEANTLDDLRAELQEIGDEALLTQEQLNDLVRNTTDAIDEVEVGKKFSSALQNSFERGQASASLDFELNIKTSSLAKAKQKIEDAFNPKSITYSKISENMTKAASATGSFISGLSTGGNLLRTMTNEASSLGEKLSSVAGGFSTLISGFATGGWIGLAVSAIGMIISGISEAQKRAREMYEEDINTKAEEAQTKIDAIKDENASISKLLPKYGELASSITSSSQISSEYQTAVNDLTTALGFQGETIDGLIAKYNSLDQAIIEGTKTQIQESINAYEQAKKDLVNKAAMNLAQNTEGIVQYGTSDSFYVDTSNLQSIINNQNTAQVYSGIGASQFNYQGIMSNLITTYSGDFSEYLMSAMQQNFDKAGNFDFNKFYESIFNQIKKFLEIDTDNFNDDEMNAYLEKANNLANFIQQFDRVFGDTQNNLGNYDFGDNSLLMLSELFAFENSHGGESKGDFSKSWLGQLASGGNLNNLTKRDQSEYWSDYVNIDTNLARETAIADSVEMSENAKATLSKMRSEATMTAEELYQFYLELTTLTEEYPELANDATYKALHAQFGTIFTGIQEPLEVAKTQLELIQNGMDITDLKSSNIDSISALRDYINEVYTKITGLNTPAPASFMKSATDLLQLWGIIPEITNAFVNELSISAGIAENAGVSQDTVLTAMDAVRQDSIWQESTTPISYEDLNWNHLQFNKKTGTFDTDSLLAEIAYAETQDRKSKAATSIAGIKTLQGYNLSEIEALGADGFEKLGIEFDDSITGFEGVKDVASWLKLSKEDRETYLTKLLEKQEEAYYAENGILQQAIDADTERKTTLEEMYNRAIASKTYTDAKAAVAAAEKQIAAGDKIISQRSKITDADIMTHLKELYGENFSEDLIQQYEIDAWRNAETDKEAKQTSFYQKVVSGQALASEGVVQEQAYLDTVAGYNAEAVALGYSIEKNSAAKEWAEMIAEAGSSVDVFSNSIKVLTQDLNTLNNEFNALNSIDVSTIPKIGTQAYDALNASLKKAGKTMSDYRQMSEKDRVKMIGQVKKENLEAQRIKQQEIEKQYADKYGFDASTIQADILSTGDKYLIAAYDAWIASQKAQADLTDKIAQEAQNTADKLISIGAANTEAAIARFEQEKTKLQNAAKKMTEVADILSDHIDGSELTFAERAKLDPAVLAQWNALTSNTERANFAAQQTATAYQKQMEYQQNINDGIAVAENYMGNIGRYSDTLLSNIANFKDSEAFANWMDTKPMSDAAKSALKEADAIVRSTLGDKATYSEWGDAMRAQLQLMGEEGSSALALLEAEGKDTISNMFSEFSKQMQSQAEAAVDAWIKAFNDISNAKQKLLSGKNLIEDIAGDPTKLIEYARAANMSVAEASEAIINNTMTADKFTNPMFDINQYKAAYGLDLTSYGGFDFGQKGLYYDQRAILKQNGISLEAANEADLTETNAALAEKYTKILTEAQLKNADGKTWSTDQINDTVAKILSGDIEAYKILTSASNDLTAAMQGSVDALKLYKTQQEALAGAQGKVTEILKNGDAAATINGVQGDQEKLTKLDAALERAQAEGAKEDANWENLSAEDRALLDSYGIDSFDEVDSAAAQCANALATLADIAYKAAETFIRSEEGGGYEQNENGEWGTTAEDGTFQVNKELTSYMQSLQDQANSADYHVTDVSDRTENYNAPQYGFADSKEWEEYAQRLIDIGEIVDENGEKVTKLTDRERKLAAELRRTEKGFNDAEKGLDSWTKDLKNADKSSDKYTKALESMRKAYADIFNLADNDADMLSETFLESEENAKLLEEAIQGNDDAFNQLQANLAKEMIKNIQVEMTGEDTVDEFIDYVANYDFDDMKIGATIDDADFNAKLNSMVFNSYDAAAQMSDALSSMGVDAEIVEHTSEVPGISVTRRQTGTYSVPNPNGPPTEYTVSSVIEETQDPHTETYYTLEGATYNGRGVSRGGSGSGGKGGRGGGGGGGGGGSKPKKIDKKDPEDEKERYYEVTKQLDRLSDELEKVDTLQSSTYGNKHLQNLQKESKLLEEQIDILKRKRKEAEGYLETDRQKVLDLGAEFDDNGIITNYEEVLDSILKKYNDFVDKYNAASASTQETMDEEKKEMDKWFDQSIKDLKQYAETVDIIRNVDNEMLNLANKISDLALERIQYKMDVQLDINKADLDILDYYIKKYKDDLDKQSSSMDNLLKQAKEYESNMSIITDAQAELSAAFASGELNEADYVDGMNKLRDKALDFAGSLEEVKKQIEEIYGNTLKMAAEEIEDFTSVLEDSANMMEKYITITGLLGRSTNYKELTEFYNVQYQANLNNAIAQRAYLDTLLEQEAYFKSQGSLSELEEQQYRDLQQAIIETRDSLVSTTESALQAVNKAYTNEINGIFKELDENIAGTAHTLAELADAYGYYQEEQERYVSVARELYEVNKLNRNLEDAFQDAVSSAHKASIKALQEEINLISKKNDLSEYDIKMLNLQYELLMARIALEEAQENKDMVRLTRDSEGNIAYQYTADASKVTEAQQKYEDVLQQINDLAANRVSELEQACLTAEQQYLEAAQEILLDTTLTDEERTRRLEELSERYSETLLYIQEQYNNASAALTENQNVIAQHYGQTLVTSTGEASTQINSIMADMIAKAQEHIKLFGTAIKEESGAAWEQFKENTTALSEASKLTFENMIEDLAGYKDANEDASQSAQNAIQRIGDSLKELNKATVAWDLHIATLESVQATYEALAQSIQNAVSSMSGLNSGLSGIGGSGIGSFDDLTGGSNQMSGEYYHWTEVNPESIKPTDNVIVIEQETLDLITRGQAQALQQYLSAGNTKLSNIESASSNIYTNNSNNSSSVTQYINVQTEFPNVTDGNEVVDTLLNLSNDAIQYVNIT